MYLFDRHTGKPLEPIVEKSVPQNAWQQTAATQPFVERRPIVPQVCEEQLAGFPKAQNLFTASSPQHPVERCPGGNGGSEWSPISYSPQTGDLYACGINEPQVFGVHSAKIEPGTARIGSIWMRVPSGKYSGTLTAVDGSSGKRVWQDALPNMCIGGTLATAGGLVFQGSGDGKFSAENARTGKVLWSFQTGAGVNAPPITYSVNGKQYVAVASGGNWQLNYPRGDTLWVFSLDGRIAQASAPGMSPPTITASDVQIRKLGFNPFRFTARPGTALTWTNDTGEAITLKFRSGSWKSAQLAPGASVTHRFTRAGSYDFTTVQIPALLGTVIVSKDAPEFPGGQ